MAEPAALVSGSGAVISWLSSIREPLLFVGDANTLAALRGIGAGARPGDRIVDLGAPGRLDDALLERARTATAGATELPVAVGGGTLNDLVKILATERGTRCALLATCASMNGWVSSTASVVRQGNKVSVPTIAPAHVVLDDDLLRTAPPALAAAGFADAQSGRYACRDWLVASWADGTAYDAAIAIAVERSLDALDGAADGPEARGALVDALLTGGLAMHEAHTSAPASGAEHLVAHAIDLHEIARGAAPSLHGHAVAIGSLLVAALWEELNARPRYSVAAPGDAGTRATALAAFLPTLAREAEAIVHVKLERERCRPSAETLVARALAEPPLPSVADLRMQLLRAGAPTRAHELGVDRTFLRSALLHARDMRDRYTVFDLAFALGALPERADAIVARSGLA